MSVCREQTVCFGKNELLSKIDINMKQMKFRSIFTMFLGLVALMGGLAGCVDRITEE